MLTYLIAGMICHNNCLNLYFGRNLQAPLETILTGRNGPGRARTVANRAGTAPTSAVRTGPGRRSTVAAAPEHCVVGCGAGSGRTASRERGFDIPKNRTLRVSLALHCVSLSITHRAWLYGADFSLFCFTLSFFPSWVPTISFFASPLL